MSWHITQGLPEAQREAAAQLYWQAFGGKLGPILGPAPRAIAHVQRVMQPDHCFAAQQDGQLVGIVGFQGDQGSFAGGTPQDFRASFGWVRTAWGLPALAFVGGPNASPNALMIDGFSVAADHRSLGIGAALLAAVADHARALGYSALELDVTSSNWRARDFYLKNHFIVQHQRSIRPLRALFGFDNVQRLQRKLG